jgi:GNAT superfamily N-acetyltransferase
MELRVEFFDRHEPTPTYQFDLYMQAWQECVELQMQPQGTWVANTMANLMDAPRWVIGMFDNGVPVGGVVLSPDTDVHVGPCMSVIAQYVLPEYRNKAISMRCMREAIRITKNQYAPYNRCLAYTHRLGDWRYITTYRSLNEKTKD